ncbi:MAG: hypothetical protein U0R50_12990 [Gaiellales bacterium]
MFMVVGESNGERHELSWGAGEFADDELVLSRVGLLVADPPRDVKVTRGCRPASSRTGSRWQRLERRSAECSMWPSTTPSSGRSSSRSQPAPSGRAVTESPATGVPRVTIDMPGARDAIDDRRARHAAAVALLALAEQGRIELAIAASGIIIDVRHDDGGLRSALAQLVRVRPLTTTSPLSYPGLMYPGPNTFPGVAAPEVGEQWRIELARWRTHEGAPPGDGDLVHAESHVALRRDIFVTNDQPLLLMCDRLLAAGIPLRALRAEDAVAELNAG